MTETPVNTPIESNEDEESNQKDTSDLIPLEKLFSRHIRPRGMVMQGLSEQKFKEMSALEAYNKAVENEDLEAIKKLAEGYA